MILKKESFLVCILTAIVLHGALLAGGFIHIPTLETLQKPRIINIHLEKAGTATWNRLRDQDNDYTDTASEKELTDAQLKTPELAAENQTKLSQVHDITPQKSKNNEALYLAPHSLTNHKTNGPIQNNSASKQSPNNQAAQSTDTRGLNANELALAQLRGRYTAQISTWYNQFQVLPSGREKRATNTPTDMASLTSVKVVIHVDPAGKVLYYAVPNTIKDPAIRDAVLATLNRVTSVPTPPKELFKEGQNSFIAFTFNLVYW